MSSTRFNLKRRIVLAAVLIPAALIAYRLMARWWAERPREYPEAYAEARALAEREFGEEAVARGVVVVPGEPVSIPWRGTAVVTDPVIRGARSEVDVRRTDACLVLQPRGGWLIMVEHAPGGVAPRGVARIARGDAARLWACLEYAKRVKVLYDVPDAQVAAPMGDIHLGGGTRGGWRARPARGEDAALGRALLSSELKLIGLNPREIIVAGALKSFVAPHAATASADAATTEQALRAALEQSFPPHTMTDTLVLSFLQKPYARLAGPRALKFLKSMHKRSQAQAKLARRAPPWYCNLPVVGGRLRQWWDARRDRAWIPPTEGLIWRVEALAGKSEEEQHAIALASLNQLGDGADEVSRAAAGVLAEKWPDDWDALLARRIEEIPLGYRFTYWTASIGPARGSEMLRAMVAGPESRTKVLASRVLWERSQESRLVESARAMVLGGADYAPDAAAWLAMLYARGDDVGGVPAFFREVLRRCVRMSDEVEISADHLSSGRAVIGREVDGVMKRFVRRQTAEGGAACAVLSALRQGETYFAVMTPEEVLTAPRGAALVDILEDIAFAPERVLAPEAQADEIEQSLGQTAVLAMQGAGERGFSLLFQAVEDRPLAQPWLIGSVLGALGGKGDVRALPALEALLAKIEAADRAGGAVGAEPFVAAARPHTRTLREAVARLRLHAAADKIAYLTGLAEYERLAVNGSHLARACDAETLKAMLADERLRWARPEIVAALHSLRMEGKSEATR